MTRFVEFSRSPYFNKHQEVGMLIDYLNKTYPDFNDQNCQREVVFKSLFPQQKHNQNHLALLFTYAIRLLDKFLIQEQFKENIAYHKVLLLRNLRQRKQYKYYEKTMTNFENELESSKYKNSTHYNMQFLKASESDAYFTQRSKHEKDNSIQLKQNNLDNYYLAEKLRDACEMIVRSKILEINYSTSLLESVISEVQRNLNYYQEIPSISVYFHIYQMIVKEGHSYYFETLPVLQKYSSYFPKEELQNMYNYLQNYCIEQINKGERLFLKEMFNLIKDQLEKELLMDDNGFLPQWHYKNIVTTSIRLKEMDWTKQFIENFKERLNPEVLENAYTYNLASYYYSTKQLDKVLDLLVKVEYTDIQYNIGAKSLLLRTYYDLEENEALLSLTRSFKQYLKRNRLIGESRRNGMSNLIRFTNRANSIKANIGFDSKTKSQKELKKLIEEMEATEPIINQGWLESKIEELNKMVL
jgi:hypothetical protein